jgi:hypothetical protein
MEKYIEKNKLSVIKKLELTSNEAVKQAVIAGLGYSIMPLIGLKNELINKDLKIIQVKGFPIKSVWNMVWQKNKNLSPIATHIWIISGKKKAISYTINFSGLNNMRMNFSENSISQPILSDKLHI